MKKIAKTIILLSLILAMLVLLVGCGENKLVATKESSEAGTEIKEKVEVKFKNNKATSIVDTYEFGDEESATSYYSFMSILFQDNTIEQEGNKIVMNIKVEDFLGEGTDENNLSREQFEASLREQGYTIK